MQVGADGDKCPHSNGRSHQPTLNLGSSKDFDSGTADAIRDITNVDVGSQRSEEISLVTEWKSQHHKRMLSSDNATALSTCDESSHQATIHTDDQENVLPMKVKHRKRKWSCEELKLLFGAFAKDITKRVMPEGYRIHELAAMLPHRNVAQIRAQVHNYVSGKLK